VTVASETRRESLSRGQRWRRSLSALWGRARAHASTFRRSKMAVAGVLILLCFTLVALFAPVLAPYEPNERVYEPDGSWASTNPPSAQNPLGTTESAHDVLTQLVWGARVAMFVGYLGAFMVAFIGTAVGLLAGYYGGWVDETIMRLVDVLYGLPFIPFVIVLAMIFGSTVWNVILGITLLYWLTTARVIRSEVLTIKERPYVEAARAIGASDRRIMAIHILPNVLPLSILYAAIAVGYSIVAQASIAFLGFGDPEVPSWGVMLQRVLAQQALDAWWWLFPPGIAITLVVVGAYLAGRGYEEIVNPQLREGGG